MKIQKMIHLPTLFVLLAIHIMACTAFAEGGLFQGEIQQAESGLSDPAPGYASLFSGELERTEETAVSSSAVFYTVDPPSEDRFSLSWTADEIGQITVKAGGQVISNGARIAPGTTITVEIQCAANYRASEVKYYFHWDNDSQNPEEAGLANPTGNGSFAFPMKNADTRLSISYTRGYSLTVNGIHVTDENRDHILGEGMNALSYNPQSNSLIFNNASVPGIIDIQTAMPLTITLHGEGNIIYGGIQSSSNLTITPFNGQAFLTVNGENGAGIHMRNGASLTISPGANVLATSSAHTASSAGIVAENGNITVYGTVNATGGDAPGSSGIRCGVLTIKTLNSTSGGMVTAIGGNCYSGGESTGITAENILVEYQASLYATSGGSTGISRAIHASALTNEGTVSATAGNGNSESTGLYISGQLTNSGAMTSRASGSAYGNSYGISAGRIRFSGGDVSSVAATAAGESYGISSPAIEMLGGSINAEGGSHAVSAKPVFSGMVPKLYISNLTSDVQEANAEILENYLARKVVLLSAFFSIQPKEQSISIGETVFLKGDGTWNGSVRWYSSNSCVTVDPITGAATGVREGTATITALVYNPSGAETDRASCTVTVKPNEQQKIRKISFDQENVTLNTQYGMRTVKYWFDPVTPLNPDLEWACTDGTMKIIKVVVDPAAQEMYITALGNGAAVITATAKDGSGVKASCNVTVSGIGPSVSYYVDYRDNDGTWFSDFSDGFTVRCTGPSSELQSVYIDGAFVSPVTGSRTNWVRSGTTDNKTLLTFSREYMASLGHGHHRISLSYSSYGEIQTTVRICSIYDRPQTGDIKIEDWCFAWLLSGFGIVSVLYQRLKRKENR